MKNVELSGPSDLGRRLKKILDSSPYRGNAKRLSLDAGLGETAVADILSGRSQNPRRYTIKQIAEKLGCNLTDLTLDEPDDDAFTPIRQTMTGRRDQIPILSAGRGGDSQEMFFDNPIGYTARPTSLLGIKSAYAIYMVGDSMEPKYEQGWLLHVNPFKPPVRGRSVVVLKTDNSVLVKRFLAKTTREWVLEQLNPPKEIRIPLKDVKEVHLIVGADEEGG